MIVSKGGSAIKVLTGSTNFSVTGMYVNSNHVLVFDDPKVAGTYSQVFNDAWDNDVSGPQFIQSNLSTQSFSFSSKLTPQTEISYAPHSNTMAAQVLGDLAKRVQAEGKASNGSVFFAVMDLTSGGGPVFPAVTALHSEQTIFSYGISDSPGGIQLYTPGKKTGVLVTGKPTATKLPPPFDQVPGVGLGHQIHHKFVVCGFNRPDAVVYCGSSNLAEGGEESNGDNLLAIHDTDVATVFMIEALGLVDHFNFLDRFAQTGATAKPPANQQAAAVQQKWFLGTTDKWTAPYFDPDDFHFVDRELFS
jgi:phosphatidylserine/phosphatidylglycerophosphate/cardiolipin synthase-like enzyme